MTTLRRELSKITLLRALYRRTRGARQNPPALLGMTTWQEQNYFEKFARDEFRGFGEIVDLGCWLGSTTIPLARGLEQNRQPRTLDKLIHAYDLFRWESWMERSVAGTELEGRFSPGESFLDEFRKRTAPWAARVRVYDGDLCALHWQGLPIEFLLVDAMKSWELANCIIRDFYSSLVPGRSIVLQQDFAHYYTSWIHLIGYRLRSYFEPMADLPRSDSNVFRYRSRIPDELLGFEWRAACFDDAEVARAFAYSMELTRDRWKLGNIAAAKVMWYVHLNDLERARREFDIFVAQGLPPESELSRVKEFLK